MIGRIPEWIFAACLLAIASYLSIRGLELIGLGGSWYYSLSGAVLAIVAMLLVMRNVWAPRLYAVILAVTVVWSIAEAGLDLMALLPRLVAWIIFGVWFLTPWHSAYMRREPADRGRDGRLWVGVAQLAGVLVLATGAMQRYNVVEGTDNNIVGTATTDWRAYGATPGGQRFATIDQINVGNVGRLKEVWRIRTNVPFEFKNTPLQVAELVYVCTAANIVIAIDATTGEERWRFDPEIVVPGAQGPRGLAGTNMYARTCRGLIYHEAAIDYTGECPKRIVTSTTSAQLFAINALTGTRCTNFGSNGVADLRKGMGKHVATSYMLTSAPLLARDKIVVGGFVSDSQELGMPSGVVRAFDVTTGQFIWAWDAGNPGYYGEPDENAEYTRGTPNVWSNMSYDPELDLIFAPTGNSSPDYYGAKRREFDERVSTATVALHGASGEPAWIYQNTHHDIWDYDSASQPVAVDITKDGQRVPIVLQPTKRGEVFAIDRRDGTPVWPVVTCEDGSPARPGGECPVPQNPAEGDWVEKTQPFSALPHFRPDRWERDMWGLTPIDQLYCRIEYKKMRYDGHLTPPMEGGGGGETGKATYGGTFEWPGYGGGFNWPSVAVDADNGLLVAAPMLMGNRIAMITQTQRDGRRNRPTAPSPGMPSRASNEPEAYTAQGAWDPEAPRYGSTGPFMSEWRIPFTNITTGVPCFEPPYGRLAVIDLNSGSLLWSRPIGTLEETGPFGIGLGLPINVGTPVYGGLMATRGGLIFQVGTMDGNMRAVDIRSGKVKWTTKLPGSTHATPITYVSPKDGRQYVLISVPNPGIDYPRIPDAPPTDDHGGWVIAYALPDEFPR